MPVGEIGAALVTLVRGETDDASGVIGAKVVFTDISQERQLEESLLQLRQDLETMREELESTNEELETTNEELQSTNEELETMNANP